MTGHVLLALYLQSVVDLYVCSIQMRRGDAGRRWDHVHVHTPEWGRAWNLDFAWRCGEGMEVLLFVLLVLTTPTTLNQSE